MITGEHNHLTIEDALDRYGDVQIEVHGPYLKDHKCVVTWVDKEQAQAIIQHLTKLFGLKAP
jgi:hypothetical protein